MINICGKDIRVHGRALRIARLDADKYESLANPEALIEGLRKSKARVDIFTFMQMVPDTTPKYAYPMEWDNLAVVPVSTFEHWWDKQIRSFPRNRARQAEKKGVIIQEVPFDDNLIQGIWEVYNESAVRQGKPNKHYGKSLEYVRDHAGTYLSRSIFIGAYLDGKMIGFAKLTTDEEGTYANLMHIVSMVRHRDKAPTNALIAQAVRSSAAHGIRYLAYQSYAPGNKENDSLNNFKEVNGFERVDLPRYYVPLTAVGRAALRLGLHRKLSDRLPESLLTRLRDLRNNWYNRRLQSATHPS
ncbi:MAG: hypothetical protein WAK29_17600 [Terriglobales bacterium]